MKTKLLTLVALVLVFSLALGCATAVAEYKFGYTCMDGTNPFFVVIEKAMREAVEANGDTLIATDPANDVTLQIQQIEDMITQGIDAIFLNPAEAEGILPATVSESVYLGQSVRYHVETPAGPMIAVAPGGRDGFAPGARVHATWQPEDVWILADGTAPPG